MGKRKFQSESCALATRVPKSVLEEIEKMVKEGHYMDVSDYLRDIVRRDLEARRAEKEKK